MKYEKDYNSEQRSLLIAILICFIFVAITLVLIIMVKTTELEETTKAFKNSEALVCYDTLIVSDSNWKLLDKHLINNNSAGYLLIENCKIKKETK